MTNDEMTIEGLNNHIDRQEKVVAKLTKKLEELNRKYRSVRADKLRLEYFLKKPVLALQVDSLDFTGNMYDLRRVKSRVSIGSFAYATLTSTIDWMQAIIDKAGDNA